REGRESPLPARIHRLVHSRTPSGIGIASKLLSERGRNAGIDKLRADREFRINGETFAQAKSCIGCVLLKDGNLGPGAFRIDEVLRHRRNPSPIIDSAREQLWIVVRD